MRSALVSGLVLALATCAGCATGVRAPPNSGTLGARDPKPAPSAVKDPLKAGWERLAASDYVQAEAHFRAAASASHPGPALLGLSQVELLTGRYTDAVTTAQRAAGAGQAVEAAWVAGEALRRQGKLAEADAVLRKVVADPAARRARLLLGEILLEQGKRGEAEPFLLSLVEDYNSDRIAESDGKSLAMVGRAAHLLRSPRDANDAFNEAERAAEADAQTLLWRAELFLEKYDPGHAEEVTNELLAKAPNHPDAIVWLAHVKLAQALDFDAAEELARKALKLNPKLAQAHFVLAGIALRDMELVSADTRADAGLLHNPRDLDLLSIKAAARFLADDEPGFEKAKRRVLDLSPLYTRMYQIVGDFADWEHRYPEIVAMMREAVLIDAQDGSALAALGLNLLRAGDDAQGVSALRNAFSKDPFNVRVFNTLNLYEKTIPESYVSTKHKVFTIRYHKDEKPILERYVPNLLDQAWQKMVVAYGFTPKTPVGIELYAERPNFAIRTSGLPNTAIQGVCFGQTLASMSPLHEQFNLGMTLWHELAHIFHIQLSKSHVPRWFTEGLAEYETLAHRPEWSREHDPDLYEALRSGRLPQVGAMNRAFTRAEQLEDVAMAYYASSQIMVMLVEKNGMGKMAGMLEQWGKGKTTEHVTKSVLGAPPEQVDRQFRAFAQARLSRFEKQFVPIARSGPIERARDEAKKAPNDAKKQTLYALALLRTGKPAEASKALAAALKVDANYADARYLVARLALAKKDGKTAEKIARELAQQGRDGYAVQMLLVESAQIQGDQAKLQPALQAAHKFDPSQSEPLMGLSELARRQSKMHEELATLKKLAALEQHEPAIYRRLLRLLIDNQLYAEARTLGEAAIWVDIEGVETHSLYGQALAATGQLDRAIFELETAVLCPGRPAQKADAHAALAEVLLKVPNRAAAARQAALARKLDPDNARLKKLGL